MHPIKMSAASYTTRNPEKFEVIPTVRDPKKGALSMAQNAASPTRHMAVFFVSPDKCQSLRLIRKLMDLRLSYARTLPQRKYYSNQGQSSCAAAIERNPTRPPRTRDASSCEAPQMGQRYGEKQGFRRGPETLLPPVLVKHRRIRPLRQQIVLRISDRVRAIRSSNPRPVPRKPRAKTSCPLPRHANA